MSLANDPPGDRSSTTGELRIEDATPEDDAQLAELLADAVMPGRIAVSYRCDRGYAAAARVHGGSGRTVVARDATTGRVLGFCESTLREVYVDGVPREVVYLNSLRVAKASRSFRLFARGVRHYRQLEDRRPGLLHLGAIAEGNRIASRVLGSRRGHMPRLLPLGRYRIAACPVRRAKRAGAADGLIVRQARPADFDGLVAFWNEHGRSRQFFPVYRRSDFLEPDSAFCGLRPEDVLVAIRGERVVGTIAGWDQRGVRKTILVAYNGALRRIRPVYNVLARLGLAPRLPDVGEVIPSLNAALHVVADDDRERSSRLFDELLRLARQRGFEHVLVGMHEDDPLIGVAERLGGFVYFTNLCCASFDEDAADPTFDSRAPYVELGSL